MEWKKQKEKMMKMVDEIREWFYVRDKGGTKRDFLQIASYCRETEHQWLNLFFENNYDTYLRLFVFMFGFLDLAKNLLKATGTTNKFYIFEQKDFFTFQDGFEIKDNEKLVTVLRLVVFAHPLSAFYKKEKMNYSIDFIDYETKHDFLETLPKIQNNDSIRFRIQRYTPEMNKEEFDKNNFYLVMKNDFFIFFIQNIFKIVKEELEYIKSEEELLKEESEKAIVFLSGEKSISDKIAFLKDYLEKKFSDEDLYETTFLEEVIRRDDEEIAKIIIKNAIKNFSCDLYYCGFSYNFLDQKVKKEHKRYYKSLEYWLDDLSPEEKIEKEKIKKK